MESVSERQRKLLALLLTHKAGLTIEQLSTELTISRNAVRQHLAVLERDGLVERGPTKPSGGRPERLYVLGEKGAELFPRRYSWFSELLIGGLKDELGSPAVAARLERIGRSVGRKLRETNPPGESLEDGARRLATIMHDLGYEAHVATAAPEIAVEASNCVFHRLAAEFPEVCHFDLGLMSEFLDATVEHRECMVRGGHVCRFKLKTGGKKIKPLDSPTEK